MEDEDDEYGDQMQGLLPFIWFIFGGGGEFTFLNKYVHIKKN